MNGDGLRQVLELAQRLQEAKIHYEFRQVRSNALMIDVHVPGERREIEFVDYGDEVQVEIERYRSGGEIGDESLLAELFDRFSDAEAPTQVKLNQNGAATRK